MLCAYLKSASAWASICIVNGAEWNEVMSFSTLAELIHYLETER